MTAVGAKYLIQLPEQYTDMHTGAALEPGRLDEEQWKNLITGTHMIVSSSDPASDRAFFRDVLGFESVDAGGGWLIFATHDVDRHHTRFGCTPDFFEYVVQCAVNSGARILPMIEALELLRTLNPQR